LITSLIPRGNRIVWRARDFERAPAGWKGDQAREAQVLNALFPLLDRDRAATLALFEIIKNQPGY
jgi:type I restriction enzyme R subunit